MEVSDNQAADNDAAADNQAASNEEGGENQQAADNAANEGGETAAAEGGNGTENDLQEIIQEMNGTEGAPADGAALAQNAANPAPVNNTPAPAPVQQAAVPAPAAAAPTLPFQPGGSPAGTGLPEMGSKMAYVVEHGDTLAKISQRIYGSPGRWNELATLSGITTPSRIYPGDLVYYTLDEGAIKFASAYEAIGRSEEQVKPGDTLATIASRVYGTSKGWRSIWRQNDKIDNPDILAGSTVYYIPKGAAAAAIKLMKSDVAHKVAKVSKAHNHGKSTVKVTKVKGFKLADGQKNNGKVSKTTYGVRLI